MARILIADDSDTDIAYLQEILSSTSHQFSIARDGLEAETLARSGGFDLFILDVIMPGQNGFQVCRALKKNQSTAQVPIILTTSKDADSDKFWGHRQGADIYITKPFSPDQLLTAVKQLLD